MNEKELRLLLVDDDELDRMAVVRALRKSDLSGEIIEEPDPNAVLARLNESDFDCILLDYDLGGITGLELLRQIRGAGFLTPVLLVTAQEELVAMSAEGATDFLPKVDVSPIRLARRIRHVMRVAGADNRARLAIAQLESQRALQEAILRQMPAAVIVADGAGEKVLLANELVSELLGIRLEPNAPIARLAECVANDAEGNRLGVAAWPIARVIRDGRPIVNEEITCVRKNGDTAILRVSASLVRDEFDRAAAAVMSLEDISVERAALAALERTKATRDEMLAIVSHDLKNPLNAIGVAIDELATDNIDAPTRDTYVGAIRRSIRRAHRLIQNLLDVSRIEAGRLKLERISMSPATLLEQARQDSHVLAKEAGLELHVRATPELPQLIVDRDLMMQVMAKPHRQRASLRAKTASSWSSRRAATTRT